MSSAELAEWAAYSRVAALPDAHWDAALVACHIANSARGPDQRPWTIKDLYPRPEGAVEELSPDASADALVTAMRAGFTVLEATAERP